MVNRLHKTPGFTLVELTIAAVLLSVVFLGAAAVYISALRFLNDMKNNSARVDTMTAMESMVRKINLANFVEVSADSRQLELRWDYSLGTFAPITLNVSPWDYTGDTWVKFAIIGGRLRWKNEASEGLDVSTADPELVPGLVLNGGSFTLTNPSSSGAGTVVQIQLVAQINGSSTTKTQAVETNAVAMAFPKA